MYGHPRQLVTFVLLVGIFSAGLMSRGIAAEPLSPEEARKLFVTAIPLQIELAASEPTIVDPVHLAFDEQGRLWVVEMRDYPNGPAPGQPPISRIKILRDLDGDGVYEKATVFADQLLFATSLLPWKGGVIVALAGKIEWMRDNDGDDRMDHREVWLEGFAEENPQLRANHPTLGPDGWIYISNGLRGGEVNVVHPAWPKLAEPISLRGKDFRFHPHTGQCESIAGNGQYGMSFDGWGNRLICSNRNPAMQVMFQFEHLASQPLLIVSSLVNDVSPSGADSRLFPLTENWTTSNLHAGQFTAACGVHSFQGSALPDIYRDHVFCCDPTANLVHGDALAIHGATFKAVNPHQQQEFLASSDSWFRPVNLKTGPDGCLYVLDMYRAVIEHPQFMPDELKTRPDLTLGNDRGRIWRISEQPGAAASLKAQTLRVDDSARLRAWLLHENSWQRETAARLISQDQRRDLVPLLTELLASECSPESRCLLISLLAQFDSLTQPQLLTALQHGSPLVRHRGCLIADRLLNRAGKLPETIDRKGLEQALLICLEDAHPHVRFQALIASRQFLGSAPQGTTKALHAVLAQSESSDAWLRKASLLGIQRELPEMLSQLNSISGSNPRGELSTQAVAPSVQYAEEISQMIGRLNQPEMVQQTLALLWGDTNLAARSADVSAAIVRGLGVGLRSRGSSLQAYLTGAQGKQKTDWTANSPYQQFVQQLMQQLNSGDYPLQAAAIGTLRHLPDEAITARFLEIAQAKKSPGSLRTAALSALPGRPLNPEAGIEGMFVEMVRSESPQMRRELIDFCLSAPRSSQLLLESMVSGRLNFRELAADQLTRVSRSSDPEIKRLLAELQARTKSTDRTQVLASYGQVLAQAALDNEQALRGKEVFRAQCATCHRIGAEGVHVGPDISDTRTKRADELLVSILDPNRAIDNNFFSYTAVTLEGKIYTGILAEETPFAITLKQAKGEARTLQRDEIDEFASDGISFMPNGMEKNITPEQMIDLVSFLKNWRYLDGQIPLK